MRDAVESYKRVASVHGWKVSLILACYQRPVCSLLYAILRSRAKLICCLAKFLNFVAAHALNVEDLA